MYKYFEITQAFSAFCKVISVRVVLDFLGQKSERFGLGLLRVAVSEAFRVTSSVPYGMRSMPEKEVSDNSNNSFSPC